MQNPFFLCFLFPCGTSSLERRQAARVHAGTSSIPSAAPSPQPPALRLFPAQAASPGAGACFA